MNSHSAGNQFRPKITELTNGNIVVSWSSFETPNNYPGKNNSNDVSIIANHDNASHDYFVQFTDDTSSGMVRPYTAGGGVDPTLDPNSKIEIMGREYTVSQGTVAAKTSNLQTQLANDGITSTIRNVGSPWGTYLEIEENSITDYIEAYGTSKFNFYGNPLNNNDGSSNDHDLLTNALPTLVPGYSKSNDIFFQRFDSAGNTLGSQTRVNSVINGNQDISAITELDGGNFVVTWQTENEDGDGQSIAAQLYNSSGQKVGSAIQVNTATAGSQKNPDIAKLADGNFVITWEEVNTSPSDYGIYGQIFNSSGNKVGAQFRIDDQTNIIGNSYVGQIESNSKVLGLSSGKFIVLYQRHDGKTGDLDTSGIGLYGQLFNADGTTAGEFPKFGKIFVNRSRKDGNQELANISESPEGNIIVTFTSSPTNGSKDIYTLFLTPDGMNLAEMEQTMGLYALLINHIPR